MIGIMENMKTLSDGIIRDSEKFIKKQKENQRDTSHRPGNNEKNEGYEEVTRYEDKRGE